MRKNQRTFTAMKPVLLRSKWLDIRTNPFGFVKAQGLKQFYVLLMDRDLRKTH